MPDVCVTEQYLKLFRCVYIKLFVLDGNTYLKSFKGVETND